MGDCATPSSQGMSDDQLDAICDLDQLRQMWQAETDANEKRRVRARMYRVRSQIVDNYVEDDEESLGKLATQSRRTSQIEIQLNSSEEMASESEHKEIIMEDQVVKSNLLKDKLNTESDSENLISMNLSGEGYSSMRNKETRDSVSPSRFHQDVEIVETIEDREQEERLLEALRKAGKTVKVIKSEKIIKSEIPIRQSDRTRSPHQSPHGSPYASPYGSPRVARKQLSPTRLAKPKSTTRGDSKSEEFGKLSSYLEDKTEGVGILVNEEEEEMFDELGNKVEMLVTTHKDRDGKEFTTRRTAKMTKVVDNVDDIDEILIGNPDHEVLERDVQEEEGEDGSMIKIITETRKRPDGVEYTTKNVLRTEKITACDNPEDVEYCEHDFLVSTSESEETDENGVTTRVVIETRRKENGQEYVSKNIYKKTRPVPCEDDEILNTQEKEERDLEGNITRVVVETRRTKNGEEYMHKQTFKCRRMTLSGVALEKGMPMMGNDDEVLDRQEKKQLDDDGSEITVVTETRRKEDGKKYTFDYILRSFKSSSKVDVKSMPMKTAGATNIKVSDDDELIREEVTEKEQEDGTTIKTIIERRRAKDGTEYLRHKIMRIPKIPEPQLTVGTFNDEILENDIEESEYNGTKIKSITERRRSSLTGLQYTLRRMSKSYHRNRRPSTIPGDDLIDENVTEENGEEGTVIKTIIRRYQRKDGTMYTTHNVNKCFTAPTEVVIEEDGDLIDSSIDQKEIDDGIVQRTVTETFERIDGTHYTFERSEKISKESASVIHAIDYTNKDVQMIVPSAEDVVLSQNVEEQPDDGGLIIRITEEERRRADGSKYSAKITSQIIPDIVPDQETSYVIIKPKEGQDDSDILPSLQDKLVYTRKKEEIDEDGNAITVVIETRESQDTGEKYNLTKRLFTADVLVTEEGEKVLDKAVVKSIDRKMNAVRKTEVNTADRSTTIVSTCDVHTSSKKNIVSDKSVKDVKTTKPTPKKTEVRPTITTAPKENRSSTPTRPRKDDLPKKTTPIKPSNTGRTISSKPTSSPKTPALSTSPTTPKSITPKKDVISRTPSAKITAADRRNTTTKTDTPSRSTRTNVKETTTVTPKRQTPTQRKPIAEKKTAEVTPTRKPATTRTPSRDQLLEKRRGSLNRTPNKSQPQGKDSASYTKTRGARSTPEKPGPKTIDDSVIKKQSPRERPSDIMKGSRRKNSKDLKTKPQSETNFNDTTDPRISFPPTPMTEEMKIAPIYEPSEVEPTIEDVSNDPNLPRHKIHRPSVVREPSKDFGEKVDLEAIEAQIIIDLAVPSTEVSEIDIRSSEPDDVKTTHKKKNITDRFGKFDEKKEIKTRRVSIDTTLDSVSSKRSMFENGGVKSNKKTDVKSPLNMNRTKEKRSTDDTTRYNGMSPVVETIIVAKHFHKLGTDDESTENIKSPLEESPEMESPKLIMRLASQDKENVSLENSIDKKTKKTSSASISDTRRSSIMTDDESKSDFSKEGSPTRFITGKPIDNGANTTKIKKIERTLSGKIDFDQLDAARNNLPEYLRTIETITDVTVLQTMLDKAESYEERRVIRGQIRIAKRTSTTSTTKNTYGRSVLDQKSRTASRVDRTQVNASKVVDSPLRSRKDKSPSPERKSESASPLRPSSRKNSDVVTPSRKKSADLYKEEIIAEDEPITDNKSTKSYSSRKMSTDDIYSSKSIANEVVSNRKTSLTKSTVIETRSERKSSTTETTSNIISTETKCDKSRTRKTSDKTISGRRTSVDKTNAPITKPKTVIKRDSRDDLKTISVTDKSKTRNNTKPVTPSYKRPIKGNSDVVSSPLRHQKGRSSAPSAPQTDVEKIISPYGCGVTDENGLPLFGLRALKRRNQQAKTAPASDLVQETVEAEKPKENEPKDASGRPMFGLKAVQKTSKMDLTDSERKASVTSVSSDRKTSKTEKDHDSSSSSSSSSDSSSDEEDINKTNGDIIKKEDVIRTRSQPLRDIIHLHEKKVQEPVESETELVTDKPKQKLRSSFEPEIEISESKQTKTWDVDSDLSTRAINIKNVMAKHENISRDMKEESKDTKKPVGILKKSSSTSQSHAPAGTTVDTSEFMDDMTDDQLAKLSDEFDRRTQEDGVIILSRGSTPDRENLSKGHRRKTSYSEITLASTGGDGSSSQHQQTSRYITTTTRGIGSTNGSTVRLNGTTNGSAASPGSSNGITTGVVNITANGSSGVTVEHTKGSFLQDKSKVTGFGDVMSRMAASEAVEGKVETEEQARSLLNRFLGAQVMMTGVESMLASQSPVGGSTGNMSLNSMRSCEVTSITNNTEQAGPADLVKGVDISREFGEETLRKLLDSCDSYEDRRKIRLRLKNIAAKAKGGAVGVESAGVRGSPSGSLCSLRSDADAASVRSWLADNFPDHQQNGSSPGPAALRNATTTNQTSTISTSSTTKTKGSGWAKFQQMDQQQTTTTRRASPFMMTLPVIRHNATQVKQIILDFVKRNTVEYESKGVKVENFSTSWSDGLAFCALIHHFFPDAFDFDSLDAKNRRYNFDLAFRIADERANVMALLDVNDMVIMKKPDWKSVFTYVQSLYRHLKDL